LAVFTAFALSAGLATVAVVEAAGAAAGLTAVCVLEVAGAAAGMAPLVAEGWAAKAEPATSVVAISAAVRFLNMAFSLLLYGVDSKIAPIVEVSFTFRALNAP
jgi:hypothetical protein